MSRRYDSRTTIFSPEGRLYQVEYAMEAIGNAGSAIGILAKDGVILVGEKKVTSKLLQTSKSTEKMYKIDDHLACAVTGTCPMPTSSSTPPGCKRSATPSPTKSRCRWSSWCSRLAIRNRGTPSLAVSAVWCLVLVRWMGQELRVSALHERSERELQRVEGGCFRGEQPGCTVDAEAGANNQAAQSMLKQDYKEEATRDEAIELALKVLRKTMDSTSLTSEKLELTDIFVSPSGEVKYQDCATESLDKLLVKSGVTQPAAESS